MIRIRSPTKEKLNSKSIAIGKVILLVAFFIERKRRNFNEPEMINIKAHLMAEANFSSFENEGEKVEGANFPLLKKDG